MWNNLHKKVARVGCACCQPQNLMLDRDQEANIFDRILMIKENIFDQIFNADHTLDHDNQSMELLTNRSGILRLIFGSSVSHNGHSSHRHPH